MNATTSKPATIITLAGKTVQTTTSRSQCCMCSAKSTPDDPNVGPLKFWDEDKGAWTFGVMCSYCAEDILDDAPEPGETERFDDDLMTDEDVTLYI